MPYKLDGSDAPANVQKLPAKRRKQWVKIWNSAFARCQAQGGKNCEQVAFKMANGVAKIQ
jgi:cation transport regulator ChaB